MLHTKGVEGTCGGRGSGRIVLFLLIMLFPSPGNSAQKALRYKLVITNSFSREESYEGRVLFFFFF